MPLFFIKGAQNTRSVTCSDVTSWKGCLSGNGNMLPLPDSFDQFMQFNDFNVEMNVSIGLVLV